MPITVKNTDPDGTAHEMTSEFDTFTPWEVWLKETQPQNVIDEVEKFKQSGVNTEVTTKAYSDWLVDRKVTHTFTTTDGVTVVSSYKDIK